MVPTMYYSMSRSGAIPYFFHSFPVFVSYILSLVHLCVTWAPCRKMDPKVATAAKTKSSQMIKVEIKIKFNSRIKR